ncbi:flagellar filament capping protein FliD [Sphingorhabdus sp.]|uniref:flagellar filament capping protein FliD n=1 Tax=Sphingorhabdus sp. TaxID=1902408 RepID=UPI003918DCCA
MNMVTSIANSLGFGSGIDTAALVADLAAASRTPKVQRFDALSRAHQAKVSTLAQARSDLDNFADSLESLASGGTLRSQPVASDTAAISITARPGSLLGSFSGQLVVQTLGKAQSAYSENVASRSAAIGQGNMSLTVGTSVFAVTIDGTNDSLDGLASAINATGSGVTASVINDAGEFKLVLKGQSGAANAFQLTADVDAPASLQRFSTSAMTIGQVASDATFTLDGVGYRRQSNNIDDVVPGINLTLKKADPLATISISATRPSDILKQTLTDFVAVFNTLKKDVETARKTNNGNPALRAFERQLNGFIALPLTSHPSLSRLSDIGIATTRDGTLALNTARLDAVLRDNPDAVEAMFNPPRNAGQTQSTDPGIAFVLDSLRDAAVATNGPLEQVKLALKREADSIGENRSRMEARELAYRSRLEKQFAGMDARITALKATQSYLEQQIKLWNSGND